MENEVLKLCFRVKPKEVEANEILTDFQFFLTNKNIRWTNTDCQNGDWGVWVSSEDFEKAKQLGDRFRHVRHLFPYIARKRSAGGPA